MDTIKFDDQKFEEEINKIEKLRDLVDQTETSSPSVKSKKTIGGDSAWLVKLKRSCSASTAAMILSLRQCVVIVVCHFSGVPTAIFCINISDQKR